MVPRMASCDLAQPAARLVDQISTIIVGKRPQIEDCVACLLAGGHLLIEDVPGVGKTTLAHALAVSLGLKFSRVQFTADLMPSDLIGVSVFERSKEPSSSTPARCSPRCCWPTRSTAPAPRRRARCSRRWRSSR
jgi:MoxR-like ATPase